MNREQPPLDLDVLARAPAPLRRPRRWWPRVLPAVLLLAFCGLWLSTLRDCGRAALAVSVVRPRAAAGDTAGAASGGELQRSGWVEPDPFPHLVRALVPGVVAELLVLEGESVAQGQEIARLDPRTAEAADAVAQAALERARAEEARAAVERDFAQRRFDAALEVSEALAVAQAEQEGRLAERDHRDEAARRGEAAVRIAEEELAIARWLAEQGGAGPRQVELAEAKVEAEQAGLALLRADARLATSDLAKAQARLERARRDVELRFDDGERLARAQTAWAAAQAARGEAAARAAQTALDLERQVVRAPTAGIVLERMAAPGAAAGPEGAPLVSLYDPQRLRVRIDVEQSEVGKLAAGGAASVVAPTRPGLPYRGTVVRIVRQANIEKVTLQVHVRIEEPDEALRPEMVVETRFALAAAGSTGNGGGGSRGAAAWWIPARLLVDHAGGHAVWLIDGASGRATLRRVEVERRAGDEALLRAGVNATDKLIDGDRAALREGARVVVAGEAR